ncbi:hypothetical protein [Hymenobacter negativus]|uniref:DUF1795 domain-containing protein n=1 Tax=Hymenobacter negativus TaxID=2795026 RepID=A0ABS3QIK1_9BACT|nr:hypothetical protein [Hymenobacter negativus]MBO2011066.1 hypothetical protein [Hymenobacter negativus]
MNSTPRHFLVALALASGLTACGSKDQPAEQSTPPTAAAPAPAETAATPDASPAATTEPAATFDLSKVPVSSADLGVFPYLAPLPGYEVNTSNSESFDFERSYIFDGQNIIAVEGKVSRRLLEPAADAKTASDLMIQRNYEELFKKLGAMKVADTQVPKEAVDKIGGDEYYKHNGKIDGENTPVYTYVIRQKDKEVWMQLELASGDYRLNVTERAPMAQQATTLKADELKKN